MVLKYVIVGDYDDTSLKILQGMGFGPDNGGAIVTWNLEYPFTNASPTDWDPIEHGSTPSAQIANMTREFRVQSSSGPGSSSFISLNHDVAPTTADFRKNGALVPKHIKPLAQRSIEYLKTKKWQFVTIDQCLGRPIGSMLRQPNPSDNVCGDEFSEDGFTC